MIVRHVTPCISLGLFVFDLAVKKGCQNLDMLEDWRDWVRGWMLVWLKAPASEASRAYQPPPPPTKLRHRWLGDESDKRGHVALRSCLKARHEHDSDGLLESTLAGAAHSQGQDASVGKKWISKLYPAAPGDAVHYLIFQTIKSKVVVYLHHALRTHHSPKSNDRAAANVQTLAAIGTRSREDRLSLHLVHVKATKCPLTRMLPAHSR